MRKKKAAYLLLLLTTALWGSFYVVGKAVLNSIPPITMILIRQAVALCVLLALLRGKLRAKVERPDWKRILFIGVVGYSVAIPLQNFGTKLSPASTASLINSMNPVFMVLFAVLILRERLTLGKLAALAAAVAGAYVIIGGAAGGALLGIALSLLSVLLWSLSSVLTRPVSGKYGPAPVTALCMLLSVACLLPASLAELLLFGQRVRLTPAVLAGMLYLGVATAVSMLSWNTGLSMLEASRCSMFYPVQPMTSVLLGALFLGEAISPRFLAGALLIVCGILSSIFAGARREAPGSGDEAS